MNTQNGSTSQQTTITGATLLAIICVTLAAGWIAFAYYKGVRADANQILLLHPIVPMLLIVLLSRVHRWIEIKSIVTLEILMMAIWLFLRMLGTLMPFILGFGFAYLFRFLWNAFPFKRGYLRGITTVVILVLCGIALFYSGRRIGTQATQMGKGLQKFYHESVLPFVVGEKLNAIAIEESEETPTIYLGTNHGIYRLQREQGAASERDNKSKDTLDRFGITNGALVGKSIQAIAVHENLIYVGTHIGLYRRNIDLIEAEPGDSESVVTPPNNVVWAKVEGTPFDNLSVETVSIPTWNPTQIYVGTENGLYSSNDSGETWHEVAPDTFSGQLIVSVVSAEDTPENTKNIYVASTLKTEQKRTGTTAPPVPTEQGAKENAQDASMQDATMTNVHWHLENSSLGWELLPSADAVPRIYALAAGNLKEAELYAATLAGVYQWNSLHTWEEMEGEEHLPKSISLLVSSASGLYAGNENIIHHRYNRTTPWQPLILPKEGILIYRDAPIIKQIQAYLTEGIPSLAQTGGSVVKWVSEFAKSAAFQFGGFLATASLAFIVFVYASQSFDNYFRDFTALVPESHRETIKAYLREIDKNMQQFLKGQVTVIAIVSVLSCIVYSIIGVPFALLIGLLAGLCNAIPTFGPFIGGGFAFIALLMGLATGDFSMTNFLIRSAFLLGAILGIQTFDNSLISPKVMSSAVDVDPLFIMFAVIVGASLLGFWGVLLAIPIIVVIKSVIVVSRSVRTGTVVPLLQAETAPAPEEP